MIGWAIALFWILVCLAAGQGLLTWRFLSTLRRARSEPPADASCPKAAVILCLRGPDPFLPACIDAILQQDYPDYELQIVVDDRDDPAWAIAEQAVSQRGATNIHMRPLTTRHQTCSLKCSSIAQVVSELDASYEVVALLDADTIPHRTWLRELAAPLADDRVAAATGNRWYVPASPSWGSLVRRSWNAAAVVQMYSFHIPWGGTLALKMSVVRRSDLLRRWTNALCEDTMLYSVLRRLGYRIAFVPSLMMVNREDCTLGDFHRWVQRQLLTVRLYHPAWAFVVAHGLSTSAVQVLSLVSLVAAAVMRDGHAVGWLVAGIGSYWGVMAGLLAALDAGVRHNAEARDRSATWTKVCGFPRTLGAMLLTQVVYPAALASSMLLRTVEWRGIRYRVKGREGIRMIEYKPYVSSSESKSIPKSL